MRTIVFTFSVQDFTDLDVPALPPAFLTLNHLMSSQPGNLQDLNACSGNSSPFMVGSEAESDSQIRQEFAQNSPLPSDMGLRFMTIPVSEDAQYVCSIMSCTTLTCSLGTPT